MRRGVHEKRSWIIAVAVVTPLVMVATLLTVPATRPGSLRIACELAGLGCVDRSPGEQSPREDRRVAVSPTAAATWGDYVALGDSYSSGDGAADYGGEKEDRSRCRRSANAYPRLLAERHDFAGELEFLACSGQRGRTMLDNAGDTGAQLTRLVSGTSLVTLGIGGNDLGFTSVLETCMARLPLLDSDACVAQEEEIETRMSAFEETFDGLMAEIRGRVPDARVLVVGYPRIFPSAPSEGYYTLTVADQVWLNRMVKRFNGRLREAVAAADDAIVAEEGVGSVEFVDAYDALDGHEVGSERPWVHGVVMDSSVPEGIALNRSSFHPTAAGQLAVSTLVDARISAGPGRELHVTRATVEATGVDVATLEEA